MQVGTFKAFDDSLILISSPQHTERPNVQLRSTEQSHAESQHWRAKGPRLCLVQHCHFEEKDSWEQSNEGAWFKLYDQTKARVRG